MGNLAPPTAVGDPQIITTDGLNTQIYVDEETIGALVWMCKIRYSPDYGPNARVYRPIGIVDADTVRSWLGT